MPIPLLAACVHDTESAFQALEVVSEDTQLMMIRELEHSVTKCVRDQSE